jgi:type 2 lantibiotic biosynthesis protein LanM
MHTIGVDTEGAFWLGPEWYRGLPLSARLEYGRPAPAGPSPRRGSGENRLRVWKTQRPLDQKALFAARLEIDALSEDVLVDLLAEPDESLKARIPVVPDWLLGLVRAFEGANGPAPPFLEELQVDHPLVRCLPAFAPLLQRGLTSLTQRVESMQGRYPVVPVGTRLLARAFLNELAPALLFQASKPFVLEMHVARLQGRLHGATPQARFEDFTRQLREDRGLPALLRKYPVLARQLVLTVDQWGDYLCELVAHLSADWDAICAVFSSGSDPGPLVEIDAGKGDRHRDGRSVVVLRFDSGLRLVYKPKPLAVDVHFQELVGWLNDRGAEPPLRPLKLIDRGDYGWCEFIGSTSCQSQREVRRFYERQGSYLALLYALDATDVHNENLIADGEHPMLVDYEALFHPHIYGQDPILAANLAAGALDESVWQVGILPRRVWADERSVGVDTSGLGGQAGQMNPHPVVGFNDPGSDDMRLGRRRVELPTSENRPRLGDREVDALDYKDAILAGFTRMYRLLCRHRSALLTEVLPRFSQDEIRVVVRPTNVYGLLLYESFHPDLLRDGLDRDRFFDRLWAEAAQRPYLARLIAAERRDLWRGDIPLFTTTPESRTIFTSDRETVADLLDSPSLDLVRQRIERLGEDDLAKQTWVIEASLATLRMDRDPTISRPLQRPATARAVTRECLLRIADDVGARLDELALQNDAGAYWLGVVPLDEFTWGVVPSGLDLYAGTTGTALFLGYLGEITGKSSHTRLAKRALRSLQIQLEPWLRAASEDGEDSTFQPIGAFEGLGSVIYGLTHLGILWDSPDLLDDAERLAGTLSPLVPKDDHLDVIYGSAGCILALLGLHSTRPSARALEVAIECGDHLLATARPMAHGIAWTTLADQAPLGGLSHGAAGFALSLLRLASHSGQTRFREAALHALEYERNLFVPELNNWADLRVFPSSESRTSQPNRQPATNSMVAWCHGAAGIGLARLGALDHLDDPTIRQEIDTALDATKQLGFDINHSLCHGALGNAELLLTAAERLRRPEDHETLARAISHVVASIQANGYITGVPLAVETPGFMTGLAGIGYELLRLADPGKVPSVLVLAPPGPRRRD